MLIFRRFELKQIISSNEFQIRIFPIDSYSFGIAPIDTFIHCRISLEKHTRFQTKMGKMYTRFQTKTAQKTLLFGAAHTYMAFLREAPPPARKAIWHSVNIALEERLQ